MPNKKNILQKRCMGKLSYRLYFIIIYAFYTASFQHKHSTYKRKQYRCYDGVLQER